MAQSLFPKEEENLTALSSDCSETLKLAKAIVSKAQHEAMKVQPLPADLFEMIKPTGT